jgi:preprotein translocase subunit SecA
MSARISEALNRIGLAHEVLSAIRHDAEARIIAGAGQPGALTIATNMAGRGTDIRLGPTVAERGGLLVICVETQPSARLERQLLGRSARQGDAGEGIVLRSLEDETVLRHAPPAPLRLNPGFASAWAQRAAERTDRALRGRIARDEDRIREALEFAGTES